MDSVSGCVKIDPDYKQKAQPKAFFVQNKSKIIRQFPENKKRYKCRDQNNYRHLKEFMKPYKIRRRQKNFCGERKSFDCHQNDAQR